MKRNVRRTLSALLSVVMLLSLLVVPAGAAGEEAKPTVWLVGDSTVSAFNDAYYYPRYGYGTQIGAYLDGTYNVQNLAISGTSSTTFTQEAEYTTLFGDTGIKAGDTLIIGFGHNDEKVDANNPIKHTTPTGDYKTAGSFANSLYENYIKKAQTAGAEVIVCTPIVRRTSGSWSNNNLHVTDEGSYPDAIKTMMTDLTTDGKATDVTMVDMTAITKDIYDELTPAETLYLHAWTSSKETSVDNTHLNIYGSKVVARALLEAVQTANASRLATHVVLGTAPTKANDLVVNPEYVEKPYEPPTTSSAQCQDYVAGEGENAVHFKGTAMGYLGGSPSAANHVRETDENGNMHIAVKNNKGKITSTYDGIAMYYYQVPAGKTFTLSAKAKVNAFDTASNPNQAAFGLMARDDMYIDLQENALASDYVVAGTFGDSSANCFRRKSGKLEKPAALSTPIQVGESYDLTIAYNGDGYTCTFGTEPTQSAGYDYQLSAVDAENVYVGMFCARSFDVTFSNIVLTVDGVELCNTTTAEVPFDFTVNDWKFADASGAESDVAVEGGKLTAINGVLDGSPADALVFVAVYNRDGKMTGVKAITPKDGEIAVGLPMNGGETAKVFILHKNTLEPYGEPFSKTSGVAPVDPDDLGHGPVQVWDFAPQMEEDKELYTNRITAATWAGILNENGSISNNTKPIVLNGLEFKTGGTERLYTTVPGLTGYGGASGATGFCTAYKNADGEAEYTAQGGLYCNGSGDATKRYLTVKDVKAGDKIVAYMGFHATGGAFHAGTGQEDYLIEGVEAKAYTKYEFVAKRDGDFKIWNTGGKVIYHRIMLIPAVSVTGAITFPADYAGGTDYTLKFTNQTTGDETVATVDKTAKTYTAKLAPGFEYNAALSGVTGWGFTNATKRKTIADADILTGATWNLAVESKSTYTYSGTVAGFAQGYDTSKLTVTMTPTAEFSTSDPVPLTLDGMNFSATLEPTVEYTITLAGVNDYQVKSPAKVTSEGVNLTEQTIEVETKPVYNVAGSFVTLDVDDQYAPLDPNSTYAALTPTVTALTFKNVDDDYTYTANIADSGYTANLRDGAYEAVATVAGYTTTGHVVVNGGTVDKDLLFVAPADTTAVAYAADVYVGDSSQTLNFKTVTGALAYIKRMTRTDGQRVTVHIAPGVYREQINVDSKDVTFVGADPAKETKLTWYYGIGYKYYSACGGNNSFYDPERAFDQYEKNIASSWGTTVRVTAEGFRAENVTFENSFNYYMTDEELADGVEVSGTETINLARTYALDVTSKDATERATAICLRAGKSEFKNCKFLSSQDTLYTEKTAYFKNCFIEGQTDYIFGSGDVVFDACQLNFKGYSSGALGGYITAARPNAGEKGYLFRGCTVTGDAAKGLSVEPGCFGRPWGADAKVLFLNTTLADAGLITAAGWTEMSGNKPENANFREYGTTTVDGAAVSTTGRVTGTVLTAAPTDKPTDYFGGWTPVYYVADADAVAIDGDVVIHNNFDDLNPTPGNTLTARYTLGAANDANDVSLIQWYRVKDGAADVLVKSAVANVDKTYKAAAADVGFKIKVTVTPRTTSGAKGTAVSATTANAFNEGWNDPTQSPGDAVLGDGVNIFLAGDSTVKDYSAKGMYNGGNAQDLGSWGEFLQNYFDSEKVTVVDYAQGGRATRNFINEGKLDAIKENIKEGDYLFIQFGHNDCADDAGYIEDRYVPVGTPDSEGNYPTTAPAANAAKPYTWDCGGTYKWFLKQYVDTAKEKGATPVLVTPVARMYYEADGSIRPHHDDSKSSNNAYVTAMKQLAQEENVLLIDGYTLTETMFENAWKADPGAVEEKNVKPYSKQVMGAGDATHCNKLGGMIEAALIAQAVQSLELDGKPLNIAYAVKAPASVLGETTKHVPVFTVNGSGVLTAYDINDNYASPATYWQTTGQAMFQAIADKAAEINAPAPTPAP